MTATESASVELSPQWTTEHWQVDPSTREMPNTSIPACRAAMASSAVDMPTRSAPSTPAIRTSAGVS